VAPTRDQAIAKAADAAGKVLASGGTDADANRAATDSLIDQMAATPGIAIAQDVPAAVKAAKAKPPANNNAQTTPSAPISPTAGLPAAGSATVQSDGVSKPEDRKAKWLKAINDQNRLAGETGIQLKVVDGKLTFMGDPQSSKQGRALSATLAEAQKAGATIQEIIASIQNHKGTTANVPQPAQPGTQASQAPSAQGAAPAVGDNTSPSAQVAQASPEKQKALGRIAAGKAWFGSGIKAQQFIRQNGLNDTHTVKKTSATRFDVVANETQPVTQGATSEPQADQAQQAEAQRPQEQPAASGPVAGAPLPNATEPAPVTANPKIKAALDKKNGVAPEPAAQQTPATPVHQDPDAAPAAAAEPVTPRTDTEHAGLKIYPVKVKRGDAVIDMWGVQTPDNAQREKNGERQIGGDPLSETLDGAKKNAEAAVRDAKNRAAREAESKAADDAAQAKKDDNKGKNIVERKRDAYLDKHHTYPPQAGLGQGTRREAMQKAVDQGRAIVERMVPDTAAKHRDQTAIDLVKARGYILGLSNENIPVVKQGLEAQARMKANQYEKPEYRVYDSAKTDGGFYAITKTEFDYAKSLGEKNSEAPVAAPEVQGTNPVTDQKTQETPKQTQQAAEPTAEQIAAIGDITIEVPTENGTAKMTVNATKALAAIDERLDALEMVQRCLA
jgi:hypothetical protein